MSNKRFNRINLPENHLIKGDVNNRAIKHETNSFILNDLLTQENAAGVLSLIGAQPAGTTATDADISVIQQLDLTASEPTSPIQGDRYINTATGTSSHTSQSVTEHNIYEWDGSDWEETEVYEGIVLTDITLNQVMVYSGTAWLNGAAYLLHSSLVGVSATDQHVTGAQKTAYNSLVTLLTGISGLSSSGSMTEGTDTLARVPHVKSFVEESKELQMHTIAFNQTTTIADDSKDIIALNSTGNNVLKMHANPTEKRMRRYHCVPSSSNVTFQKNDGTALIPGGLTLTASEFVDVIFDGSIFIVFKYGTDL